MLMLMLYFVIMRYAILRGLWRFMRGTADECVDSGNEDCNVIVIPGAGPRWDW